MSDPTNYNEYIDVLTADLARRPGYRVVLAYLARQPQHFRDTESNQSVADAIKSWDSVATSCNAANSVGDAQAWREVAEAAQLALGANGKSFANYVKDMVPVRQLAAELMDTGIFNEAEFSKTYKTGFSPDSQFYGYRVAAEVAHLAAIKLSKSSFPAELASPETAETARRLGEVAFRVEEPLAGFTFETFKATLAKLNPQWANEEGSALNTSAAAILSAAMGSTPEQREQAFSAFRQSGVNTPEARQRARMAA